MVYNHPNSVVACGWPWKSMDEIHSDMIPLPKWNLKGLEQTTRSPVLHLDLLTGRTKRDESGNVSLHPWPSILPNKVTVHLGAPRVHRKSGVVKLRENLLPKCLWNIQTTTK